MSANVKNKIKIAQQSPGSLSYSRRTYDFRRKFNDTTSKPSLSPNRFDEFYTQFNVEPSLLDGLTISKEGEIYGESTVENKTEKHTITVCNFLSCSSSITITINYKSKIKKVNRCKMQHNDNKYKSTTLIFISRSRINRNSRKML